MNAILDVLKLRRVKLDYISPPVCPGITVSSSSGSSVFVEANEGAPTPVLRLGGQCDSFILWDDVFGAILLSLYRAQNPNDPESPFVPEGAAVPVSFARVCSPGWWTVTTIDSLGTESAQSDPVASDGVTPVLIYIPKQKDDSAFRLYKNPDFLNKNGNYLPVLLSETLGAIEICDSEGRYRAQLITDDGISELSNTLVREEVAGCCPPQLCSEGRIWDSQLCSCTTSAFIGVTADLSQSCVGEYYLGTFTAVGSEGPTTWEVVDGLIPPGMTFIGGLLTGNTTTISGIAASGGSHVFTVRATDSFGTSREAVFTLGSMMIDLIPAASTDTAYSQQVTVTGGAAPYSFSVVAGSFPSGISMSPEGLISGVSGFVTSPVTIRVTDASGASCDTEFTIAGCPTVSDYPVFNITAPNSSGILAGPVVLDTARRYLWVPRRLATRESMLSVSTITGGLVSEILGSTDYPSVPFGSLRAAYDPVHDVVVMIGQAFGWERFDPEASTFSFTYGGSMAQNGGSTDRLACDTLRGNVLGTQNIGDGKFEVVQTTKVGFSPIYASAGYAGKSFKAQCYNEELDKYVILNVGTPPLYYVDPVSFAVTLSGIGSTSTSNLLVSCGRTPWVVYQRSDNYLDVVDVGTDSIYYTTGDPGGTVIDAVYNYCTGILYVASGTGVRRWNLLTKQYLGADPTRTYPSLSFDPASGLVYGIQNSGTAVTIYSM